MRRSNARARAAGTARLPLRRDHARRARHGAVRRGGERLRVPSVARTVFDVSGAGDTVIAVLTLALAAEAPIEAALQLANFAAGAVVEKLGTATASPEEILALVEADNGGG